MNQAHEEISTALPPDLDALPRRDGFRLRGLEMTRLEAFVDASFAFAVSMLVIAGQQVPDDTGALLDAFKNVPAFAASVYVLSIFWRGHWLWSRRYGLEGRSSIFISWLLIFTMLIYVYPLKIIFNAMFAFLSNGQLGRGLSVQSWGQARAVFALYALGFCALSFEMLLLNAHALRMASALRLNARETLQTQLAVGGWSVPALTGLLAFVFALTLPRGMIAVSGWLYFSLIPSTFLYDRWAARRLERQGQTEAAPS